MGKRAWQIEDQYTHDGGEIPAYDQLVDLVGSLVDTLRVVGGQLSIATQRVDTKERVAGIKKFETVGYLVMFTDQVPGVPAAPAPAALEEPADGDELEIDDSDLQEVE